jgi:hypothetical protein
MATFFSFITDEQAELIKGSPVFFVATTAPAPSDVMEGVGPINLSPKGGTSLHIIDRNHIAFLDYAGSGNETARHTLAGSPITVMVCSFEEENAAIVRLYGRAQITALEESPLAAELLKSGAKELKLSPRQVVEIHVEKTATSCGYGVPIMTFTRERRTSNRGRRYKTNRR